MSGRRVIADSDDSDEEVGSTGITKPTNGSSSASGTTSSTSNATSTSTPTKLTTSDSAVPITALHSSNGGSNSSSTAVGSKRPAPSDSHADQPAAKKAATSDAPMLLIPKKSPIKKEEPKKEPKDEPKPEPMDTSSPSKVTGTKRKVTTEDSDGDVDDDFKSDKVETPSKKARTSSSVPTTPTGRASRAAASKKPSYKEASSDEEDSSEDEFATTKTGTPKAKKATRAAPKKSPAKKAATPKKKAPAKKATASKSPAKKKAPAKKAPAKKGAAAKKAPAKKAAAAKKEKKEVKPEEPIYKWWLHEEDQVPLPEGHHWRTLEHNGVVFAPPYVPHGIKMRYDGKPIELEPEQEEVATFFATVIGSDHAENPTFCKNFFEDWLPILNKGRSKKDPHPIKKFELCDFRPIHKHLVDQREAKKNRPKEERDKEKAAKDALQSKYGYALVDGIKQDVGNYNIEPPSLFRGRGAHPKTGRLKTRVQPEQVTINIGKEAPVPPAPEGHKWGKIIHNPEVTWLAMWRENINGAFKYVHLGTSSKIKQMSDRDKFEKARKLKDYIDDIRKTYTKELTDSAIAIRQRATALYLIDVLALRAGNEKDGDEEADTVGCCSLRVEHVDLSEKNHVKLDFLGKDSMRYQNDVEVPEQVYKNFRLFTMTKNPFGKVTAKKPDADLFDQLDTTKLNKHLKELMPGLSAKVFRTYNASITLQQELDKMPAKLDANAKVVFYNDANREVAILCNHQRTIPKTHGAALERMDAKIALLKTEVKWLKAAQKAIKDGKTPTVHKVAKMNKETKKEEKVPYKYPTTIDGCKTKIQTLNKRIATSEASRTIKDKLSDVSLSTSKINYMDPRITAAWCTKHDVELKRVFNQSLMKKFPWAMDVGADWVF